MNRLRKSRRRRSSSQRTRSDTTSKPHPGSPAGPLAAESTLAHRGSSIGSAIKWIRDHIFAEVIAGLILAGIIFLITTHNRSKAANVQSPGTPRAVPTFNIYPTLDAEIVGEIARCSGWEHRATQATVMLRLEPRATIEPGVSRSSVIHPGGAVGLVRDGQLVRELDRLRLFEYPQPGSPRSAVEQGISRQIQGAARRHRAYVAELLCSVLRESE
jgi:hypothetical protein